MSGWFDASVRVSSADSRCPRGLRTIRPTLAPILPVDLWRDISLRYDPVVRHRRLNRHLRCPNEGACRHRRQRSYS
jgi:hypothetical protein